ncbi:hypothetical protein ACRAWB_13525 [Leifsonia poae]|uniref:hypothetical protein n=1 Tax=Leifsonia poae TaxID=110933 RepID=UPI003D68D6CC
MGCGDAGEGLPPAFRLIPALALLPVGMWAALAIAGATASGGTAIALPLVPMGVASLLDVAVAATAAVVVRRHRPTSGRNSFLRFFLGLVLSACAVSAITIPALTLTDAGVAAVTVHHHH